MFAIPGVIALIVFIYARPQEFFERLRVIPLLYVFFALAMFGVVLDVRLRNTRLFATPQLPWALALLAWASLTILIRAPDAALAAVQGLSICMALLLLIAHGAQSF